MTLLQRYCDGDGEHVWRALIKSGLPADDVQVVAIATETVHRARRNLRRLYDKLVLLGYEFAEPEHAFVETTPAVAAPRIDDVESELGTLPTLARIWYQHIESVNFAQTSSQCSRHSDHPLANLGWFAKLIYLSLPRCLESSRKMKAEYREWYEGNQEFIAESGRQEIPPDQLPPFLPLGAFASNNEPKGFQLPGNAPDAPFFDDGDVHYFHDDIRFLIMSGGFPRLVCPSRDAEPSVMKIKHPDPEGLYAYLTADLEPL